MYDTGLYRSCQAPWWQFSRAIFEVTNSLGLQIAPFLTARLGAGKGKKEPHLSINQVRPEKRTFRQPATLQ